MRAGVERVGLIPRVLEEKEMAPEFAPNVVICAPYVDNANLAADNECDCQRALEGILAEFEDRKLVYHEVEAASNLLRTVGVVIDFSRRRVHHQPDRIFRLDLCLLYLLCCIGTTGHAMRIVLGHVVYSHYAYISQAIKSDEKSSIGMYCAKHGGSGAT